MSFSITSRNRNTILQKPRIRVYQSKVLVNYKNCQIHNKLCIPESFNTNILHKLFEYTITFVNSKSKGDIVLKNWF